MILGLRSGRKIFKTVTSKIIRGGSSKRERGNDNDPNDDDYSPNPSELVAESSIGGVGDDSAMEVDDGSDEDEILNINANFLGRNSIAKAYSNARLVNHYECVGYTNILFFHTQVQTRCIFGHMVKKSVFKHASLSCYSWELPLPRRLEEGKIVEPSQEGCEGAPHFGCERSLCSLRRSSEEQLFCGIKVWKGSLIHAYSRSREVLIEEQLKL